MKKTCLAMLLVFCLPLFFVKASYSDDFFVIPVAKRAKRTILVSPKNTPAESGTALLDALNGISAPSSSSPYLIILEPGEYSVGTTPLQMRSYVDIQGSGEENTKITGFTFLKEAGVVQGKDDAELRFLTVKNVGGWGYYSNAMYNYNTNPSLLHVTLEASGGTENRAMYNKQSDPTMTHVFAFAHGGTKAYGLHNNWSSPKMYDVSVEASTASSVNYGVYNELTSYPKMNRVSVLAAGGDTGSAIYFTTSSSAQIHHSLIDGEDYAIECEHCINVYVANTQLKGDVYSYNGTAVKCAGVFDHGYTFFTSTCP